MANDSSRRCRLSSSGSPALLRLAGRAAADTSASGGGASSASNSRRMVGSVAETTKVSGKGEDGTGDEGDRGPALRAAATGEAEAVTAVRSLGRLCAAAGPLRTLGMGGSRVLCSRSARWTTAPSSFRLEVGSARMRWS